VKAVSDGLAKLAVRSPQPAQMLEWKQTPASSRHIANKATDQARMMTIAKWWVPGIMAFLGAALLVLGVIGRRRNRGGSDTPVREFPPAPVEPPTPETPIPAPVGAPRVPEPV
jgi:hypothetical protein